MFFLKLFPRFGSIVLFLILFLPTCRPLYICFHYFSSCASKSKISHLIFHWPHIAKQFQSQLLLRFQRSLQCGHSLDDLLQPWPSDLYLSLPSEMSIGMFFVLFCFFLGGGGGTLWTHYCCQKLVIFPFRHVPPDFLISHGRIIFQVILTQTYELYLIPSSFQHPVNECSVIGYSIILCFS